MWELNDTTNTWTNISGNLPNAPAWSLVIDPRDGYLYVGNDEGVYYSTTGGASWSLFGSGMPDVQVKSLELNQTTNVLTAGTYGRGVFQLSLDAAPGLQQTLTLNGATPGTTTFTLTYNGQPTSAITYNGLVDNGIAGSDDAYDIQTALNALPNIGGKAGYVTVSADPTDTIFTISFYGSVAGTTSQIQADVTSTDAASVTTTDALTPVGGIVALSGQSTWTGPIVLDGDTTISTDGTQTLQNGISAATLTIVGTISNSTESIQPELIKIGQGTLVLAGANLYSGETDVQQGVLEIANPQALTGVDTVVETGAAMWLESSLNLEPVILNGNGIEFDGHNTGALQNISNNNTYTGTLTLNTDSTIGVDSGSTLTIGDSLGDGTITGGHNLVKELAGTLILADPNDYGGTGGTFDVPNIANDTTDTLYPAGTVVSQGILTIEDSNALGADGNTTTVLDGAQLQLQAVEQVLTLTNPDSFTPTTFTLTFNNATTPAPISYVGDPDTDAADIQAALQALPTVGGVGGTVTVTADPTDSTFTIVFGGLLTGQSLPLILANITQSATTAAVTSGIDVPNTENLRISGTGSVNTGALESIGGTNTWEGNVTLSQDPGFAPPRTRPLRSTSACCRPARPTPTTA